MNLDILTADVIGDIAIAIAVSQILGWLARKCGQPTVVGQIIAGILLGPSVLGHLPGNLTSHLFIHAAIPYISIISQVAIVIFMFTVGYEIESTSLRHHGRATVLIGAGALLIPFAIGLSVTESAGHVFMTIGGVHAIGRSFVCFMGVAISITALPVLAAIVRERGLTGTAVGTIAVAAAGLMDVAAWLFLAAALVGTKAAGSRPLAVSVLLLVGFVLLMFLAVRPVLRWWLDRPGASPSGQVPIALVLAFASAYVTGALGLHPVFGAFLAGLTMPGRDGKPDAIVLRSLERTGDLLLPLFFVVTGLTMNIGGLRGSDAIVLLIVLASAVLGKMLPAYGAARLSHFGRRDSALIATLVNTRGLTELIALNIGLSAGILNERLFTVLVLMALITTIATGPLVSLLGRGDRFVQVAGADGDLAAGRCRRTA